MKKPVIISIVVLLAVLLFLQYMQRKSAAPSVADQNQPAQAVNVPGGVPLPAEATSYASPSMYTSAPAYEPAQMLQPSLRGGFTPPSSVAGKGPLATIPDSFANSPICREGRSLNDVLSSHGKAWGYGATGPEAFYKNESDAVYAQLAKFFSCQAVGADSPDMCNFLPGVQTKGEKYFSTPNYQCVDPSTKVLFFAYAAGKYKSDQPCRKLLAGNSMPPGSAPPGFCDFAAKGFASLCEQAGPRKADCNASFPSSQANCKDAECLESYKLYSAMKSGSAAGCPKTYAGECAAFFAKSPSGCTALLPKLGEVFCQAQANHLSKAEKATMEEINKRARDIIKKGGGQ